MGAALAKVMLVLLQEVLFFYLLGCLSLTILSTSFTLNIELTDL